MYWKSQYGENRIKAGNLISGSRGTPDAGDPETQDETFIAPVDAMIEGAGLLHGVQPQQRVSLGQFNPIRNGTAHRLNWEVISILQNILRKEDKDFLDAETNMTMTSRKLSAAPGQSASRTAANSVRYWLPQTKMLQVSRRRSCLLITDRPSG